MSASATTTATTAAAAATTSATGGTLVHPAPTLVSLRHPSHREREATLKSFRYHLRERERELLALGYRADHRGPRAWVGVAGDAERCPVAAWLRLERGYGKVIVHSGDGGGVWPYGREATFSAYAPGPRHSVGAALGVGYCDLSLTAAIAWLDGLFAGAAVDDGRRLLSVAECLSALDEMARVWPETVARLTPTLDVREPLKPRASLAPLASRATAALVEA